ncbi:MAG: alpha-glucuronidase [Ruminococcus sp.]|jgi:alpha-glucuronidase|nr:alpha-glucuronidase [Ruminococcus sp.]
MFKYRVINHWDNMDGSVERGYAGNSLFFKNNKFDYDKTKIESYAKLLGSIGINQISLNNVNVNSVSAKLITEEFLPDLAKIAEIFRKYGIALLIAIEFSAPKSLGGLPSCDPCDRAVADWWKAQTDIVYSYIPDLAGFLVKADSEFRDGPASLGRSQADGANVIAAALAPHGGILYWRCFVYNCRQDWRDTSTDRAKAAYNEFFPLDGKFAENVILQIKNGPLDFQVREPLSPLLGNMINTREALELQITQEYTGQQKDLFALAVQWEEYFNSPVSDTEILADICGDDYISSITAAPKSCRIEAICGVANVGDDKFLCGNPLAEANLYAFGRFGQNPHDSAKAILSDWTKNYFGKDIPEIAEMLYKSKNIYEMYTSPLALGWMVTPHYHYGPSPEGYEYDKWGTYHRANHTHVGVDRTSCEKSGTSTGTGYTEQYHSYLAKLYNKPETTPEELLLFFHRLPYDYKLKSGQTLLQYIYDTHFEGAEGVKWLIKTWQSVENKVPADVFEEVQKRLSGQLENAKDWRDIINTYFYRFTGIPDEKGRLIYA